jgi:hypothetical protein
MVYCRCIEYGAVIGFQVKREVGIGSKEETGKVDITG